MNAGSAGYQLIGNPIWTPTDNTASGSIQITGQAYVNNANDLYNGVAVTRWNMGRIHRITNFPGGPLMCKAIATTNTNNTGYLTFVANGVVIGRQVVAQDGFPKVIVMPGVPQGTVEIWEDFQARTGTLNNGADAAIGAVYCTHVYVPPTATMARATVSDTGAGIVIGQDSLVLGNASVPWITNAIGGQLRLALEAKGNLLAHYGYGSGTQAGDGKTPAQSAADISRLWANMGATNKRLVLLPRPNDYRYFGAAGVSTTPAQLLTSYGALLDALNISDPGYKCDFMYNNPQGTAESVDRGGGTIAAYWAQLVNIGSGRSFVTVWDMTTAKFSLVLATDYAEATPATNGIHFGAGGVDGNTGHTKVANAIKTFPNILPYV